MPLSHTHAHIVLMQPRFPSFVCSELAADLAGDHGLQSSLGWWETEEEMLGAGAVGLSVGMWAGLKDRMLV